MKKLLSATSLILVIQTFGSLGIQVAYAAGTVGTGAPASCTEVAMDAALAGGGLVDFNCGGADHTIIITSTKIIVANTSIDGSGLITISGGNSVGVFVVNAGATLTIENLTVVEGNAPGPGGGAILNLGELYVNHSQLHNNQTPGMGGGIMNTPNGTVTIQESSVTNNRVGSNGGGIYNQGSLTVEQGSRFASNTAFGIKAGGIANEGGTLTVRDTTFAENVVSGAFGGAIDSNMGTAMITDTTFSGNEAGWGGAISVGTGEVHVNNSRFVENAGHSEGGAINIFDGHVTVDHSTFERNTCLGCAGGAIRIRNDAGSANVSNSTFSGNVAGTGGGIFTVGTLEVINSTFYGNDANSGGTGGGLWVGRGITTVTHSTLSGNMALVSGGGIHITSGGLINLTNNIVANNIAPTYPNCHNEGAYLATGDNLSSDDSCPDFTLPNTDPRLGPLGNYGGPTETLALLSDSPAIDGVVTNTCPPPDTDQRGVSRAQGAACDLGAFEFQMGTLIVDIDIKPGNKRNQINSDSNGAIWVAILSDSNFDPLQIRIPTVRFGRDKARAIRHRVKDINRDGSGDLLVRFKIREIGIKCGDTQATLRGKTFLGQRVKGSDSIKTVGC